MFVRFEGEGGRHCLPYFIALDHEKRAVVLAIRGTLSLQDTVTGALCRADSAQVCPEHGVLGCILISSASHKACTAQRGVSLHLL